MHLERLRKAISAELIKLGPQAKEKLAIKAKTSVSTIRNIEAGQVPTRGVAYKVAVACDFGEKQALLVAEECAAHHKQGQRTA